MTQIIAKNVTAGPAVDVTLDDLGAKVIPASGQIDLGALFPPEHIYYSEDLKTQINAGNIIMNNGSIDLSLANSLDFVTMEDKYSSSTNDDDAIHDNIANEINLIAAKTAILANDLVIIEDSAAGYVKKKVLIKDLLKASGVERSQFFSWSERKDSIGEFKGFKAGSGSESRGLFRIPTECATLLEVGVIGIPEGTNATADIDLFSQYASAGELYTTHSGSNTTSTYNIVANTILKLNATSIFGSAAAGDYCAIRVKHNGVGMNIFYIGIFIRYLTSNA